MSKTYVPPEVGITGPWLLDKKMLEELDVLIDKIDTSLNHSQEKEIEEKEAERIGEGKKFPTLNDAVSYVQEYSLFEQHKKTFNIISKDKSRLTGGSLRELVTNSRIEQFKPEELNIDVEYGKSNVFHISFKRSILGDLRFTLDCYDPNIQDDLKYEVQGWIDDNKPTKASQIWRNYGSLIFTLSMILVWFTVIIFSNPKEISSLDVYQKEIAEILEKGVDDSNSTEALELLLKLNINHIPEEFEPQLTYDYNLLKFAGIGLIIALLGLYPPKTTIGVGKYKRRIQFYRFYIKAVLITVPSLLILGPLVDWIKILFYN